MAGALVTRNIVLSDQGANGLPVTGTTSLTADSETNFSQLVPINAATVYAIEFAYAAIQSFTIQASAACTITFKNASSSEGVYVLAAGQICHWDVAMYAANATAYPAPFAANITSISCNCAAVTQLEISVLLAV